MKNKEMDFLSFIYCVEKLTFSYFILWRFRYMYLFLLYPILIPHCIFCMEILSFILYSQRSQGAERKMEMYIDNY